MTRVREFLRKISYTIHDAISFGDLIFVAGIALVFYGLQLVYGLGWACIGAGAMLVTAASAGDFVAMIAMLVHGGKGKKA